MNYELVDYWLAVRRDRKLARKKLYDHGLQLVELLMLAYVPIPQRVRFQNELLGLLLHVLTITGVGKLAQW